MLNEFTGHRPEIQGPYPSYPGELGGLIDGELVPITEIEIALLGNMEYPAHLAHDVEDIEDGLN